MKDEAFSRFALCVSDHCNRVGFAVLCDLECKTLVYRNARTRTMLERITIAAGRQSDYAAGTDERAACDYQGKDFIRAFQLAGSDVEKLSQMLRIRDYTRFKQFCANFTLNGDIERARPRKEQSARQLRGLYEHARRFPSHRRLSQLRPYPAAVRRTEALGHGPVRPLDAAGCKPHREDAAREHRSAKLRVDAQAAEP